MPGLPTSPFLFTVCQVGAEAALKKEISRTHPELRFAYSRPGFVTFKHVETDRELAADFELRSVFARAYGLSTGKIPLADAAALQALLDFARQLHGEGSRQKLRLHIWERDQHFPGDEPLGYVANQWADQAREAIRTAAGTATINKLFNTDPSPLNAELVLDVVAIEKDEWWYGFHLHSASHSIAPGGKPRIKTPAAAPSRAYVKMEEALLWSGAPLQEGDTAVEIGSAPGGASYALLQRGLRVVGIDPGEMDPRVLNFKGKTPGQQVYAHISKPVAQVPREDLPDSIEWLLLDMNVEPRISLFAVDRLATRMRDSLMGVFLTVKLNKWKFADEIPSMLAHVREMGMPYVRATQLASNRQEILIHGLTPRGVKRLSKLPATK